MFASTSGMCYHLWKCHKIPGIICTLAPTQKSGLLWHLFTNDTWKLLDHSITLSYKIFIFKGKTANTCIHSLFRFAVMLLSGDSKDEECSKSFEYFGGQYDCSGFWLDGAKPNWILGLVLFHQFKCLSTKPEYEKIETICGTLTLSWLWTFWSQALSLWKTSPKCP